MPTFSPVESLPLSDAAITLEVLLSAVETAEAVVTAVTVGSAEFVREDEKVVKSLVVGARSLVTDVEELDEVVVAIKLDAAES